MIRNGVEEYDLFDLEGLNIMHGSQVGETAVIWNVPPEVASIPSGLDACSLDTIRVKSPQSG
jgi:hypothetical protein